MLCWVSWHFSVLVSSLLHICIYFLFHHLLLAYLAATLAQWTGFFFVKFACQWERWYTRNVTKAAGGLWCWQKESYCQPGCRFINKTSILFQDRKFLMWFSASSKLIGLSLCVLRGLTSLETRRSNRHWMLHLSSGRSCLICDESQYNPNFAAKRPTPVLCLFLRCNFVSFDVLEVYSML